MKIDLLFSDLDHTLYDEETNVCAESLEAIKEYIAAGGKFVISSGRMIESLIKQRDKMGLPHDMPLIGLNGGVTLLGGEKSCVTMPLDDALCIAAACEEAGLYYHVYDAERLYVESENPINRRYRDLAQITMHSVGKITDFLRKGDIVPVKLLACDTPEVISEYYAKFSERFRNVNFYISNRHYLEVGSKEGGKGAALVRLADKLGVPIERTAAIGDSLNDLSMIKAAGKGGAVGNALDEVKQAADVVVAENGKGGVAEFIRKYCL